MAGKSNGNQRTTATRRLQTVHLGELFKERREPGRPGLPIMSVTMTEGIVDRESLDRRVLSDLRPEQHLLARKGDIAYNMMRMWQGVSGLVPYDCLVSPAYVILEPLSGIVPEFAAYFLKSEITIRKLHRFSQGLTGDRLRLYYEQLKDISVEIPDTDTQTIASRVLIAVDEVIEATRAVIEQTRQLKSALIQELLTKGLPGRHKRFRDNKYLGRMPASWGTRPIGKVCRIELGKMLSEAVKTGRYYHPYLGNSSVLWGRFDVSNLEQMDIRDDELDRYSLRPGDILVCEGGEVGRTAVWKGELELCCYQKAIHRLRPHEPGVLVPEFMRYFMEHAVRNGLLVRFTGESSIAHLTRETLVDVPMSLPPFEEQEEITKALISIEKRSVAGEQYFDELIQMKSALSQGLLTGRIPVSSPAVKLAASRGMDARKSRKD